MFEFTVLNVILRAFVADVKASAYTAQEGGRARRMRVWPAMYGEAVLFEADIVSALRWYAEHKKGGQRAFLQGLLARYEETYSLELTSREWDAIRTIQLTKCY